MTTERAEIGRLRSRLFGSGLSDRTTTKTVRGVRNLLRRLGLCRGAGAGGGGSRWGGPGAPPQVLRKVGRQRGQEGRRRGAA